MKKMLVFLLLSILFVSGSYSVALNGDTPDATQAQTVQTQAAPLDIKKIKPISRDSKDPLVLTLLDRKYFMLSSEAGEDSNQWGNVYAPKGTSIKELNFEKPTQDVIFIFKIADTTCSEAIEEMFDPLADSQADSFDTRNPNDQLISVMHQEEDSTRSSYLAMRFVQNGRDVFSMWVWVLRGNTPADQWQQTSQAVLSALQHAPSTVLTEHFIDSPCRFGSDCRFN